MQILGNYFSFFFFFLDRAICNSTSFERVPNSSWSLTFIPLNEILFLTTVSSFCLVSPLY